MTATQILQDMENTHPPMIFLLNAAAGNKVSVKNWLEESRFRTFEVDDIFQALEELSDFTVRDRPDVIVMEVGSLSADFSLIREMIHGSPGDEETPIFGLSKSGNIVNHEVHFRGDLTKFKVELDKMFPTDMDANVVCA